MNKSYRSHKGHRRARRGWRSLALPLALVGAAAMLAGWLLDMNGWGALEARATEGLEGVRISEVQNRNALTLPNADGSGPAWIELENTGDGPVSLKGLCLTRDTKLTKTLVFPDIRMEPGEFLLIYADGRGTAADGALHAPFRLPKSGAHTLYLYDSAQKLLDEVIHSALDVAFHGIHPSFKVSNSLDLVKSIQQHLAEDSRRPLAEARSLNRLDPIANGNNYIQVIKGDGTASDFRGFVQNLHKTLPR